MMNRGEYWAQLARDASYDYHSGTFAGEVRIADVAHSLAGINRYNSWTGIYWPVASHAVLVAEILAAVPDNPPALVLGGLHHDDRETLVGDMISPFLASLSDRTYDELKRAARRAQFAIESALGIAHIVALGETARDVIKAADIAALEAERRWLFTHRLTWATETIVDPRLLEIAERILAGDFTKDLTPAFAAERYIARHNALLQVLGAA